MEVDILTSFSQIRPPSSLRHQRTSRLHPKPDWRRWTRLLRYKRRSNRLTRPEYTSRLLGRELRDLGLLLETIHTGRLGERERRLLR